jgi:hypothetical protein
MGTVTKLNNILCANISKVDSILKANAYKWDENIFCPGAVSPTPTPTITPTPTPTPVCTPSCCEVELCFDSENCEKACSCDNSAIFYIHVRCANIDPCELAYADGIFTEDTCTNPARPAYYSQGGQCYYWDGSTLSYQGGC